MIPPSLPAPLTPADCDLRGYEWMPFFGDRLFSSNFDPHASDSEFRAAIKLWWEAWKQVPAASLPDDDKILCKLAGLGRELKTWSAMRKGNVLHGFIKCSDGRLYHSFLAEQAIERFSARLKAAQKRRKDYERLERWRAERAKKAHAETSEDADETRFNVASGENETSRRGEERRGEENIDSGATHLPPAVAVGDVPATGSGDLFHVSGHPPSCPPPDARALLFGWGLDTLTAMTGRSEASVRSWMGKMLKALHDDAAVLNFLIQQAIDERPIDPTAWLSHAVTQRAGGGRSGKPEAFGHIAETSESEMVRRYLAGEIDVSGREIRSPSRRRDEFHGTTIDGVAA